MLFVILISCLVMCIVLLVRRNHNYWKKRGIVQVDGVLLKFFKSKRAIAEIYKEMYDEHQQNHIGFFVGSPMLMIKDVQDLQAVFQSNFQNFYSRGIFSNTKEVLADNVLSIDDYRRWKLLRQKLSPVFTSLKLKNMFYIMEKCARDFIKLIEEKKVIQSETFKSLSNYTTSCIGASLFGIDTHTQNTMDSPFLEMTQKTVEPTLLNNLKVSLSFLSPTLSNALNIKIFGDHEEFFVGTVKKMLHLHRKSKEKRHDFIDTCIELQDQGTMVDPTTGYEIEPTDEVIAAQAFFFFIAGVDTSATTMHFTLLELASNPDILRKVHAEIDNVYNECNENVTYEDIEKLNYLDMVISESLRKYPPIGAIQRKCSKSTTLPSGMYIKKDDLIVIPVYGLHRDEKYFPNPIVFDPERFSPENVSKIVKFSYLPFGEGNRMCIGLRFARIQMKSGLAWLLRRFTLKEQNYEPKSFPPSLFAVKDTKANIELISRKIQNKETVF